MARPVTILLVDDDSALLLSVAGLLRQSGYRVVAESVAAQALAACKQHSKEPYDLLITDICMPDINGFELARQVQTAHPDITVLYMTGDTEALRSLRRQDLPYLAKPFRAEELETAVRAVLASHSKEKKNS